MKLPRTSFAVIIVAIIIAIACQPTKSENDKNLQEKIDQYKEIILTSDLLWLSDWEREVIPILMSAADIVDQIFWSQSYGPKQQLMEVLEDPLAQQYALINYGPWGRLEGHTSFVQGYGDKPLGAQFYPSDMDRQEFTDWDNANKTSPYTLIRRDEDGKLFALPYTEAYAEKNRKISDLLNKAASISEYEPFKNYLVELSNAIISGDFTLADKAWMKMKNNNLDFVLRPLDQGEDRLFGFKAAHSSYTLIKDLEWSERLKRFSGIAANLKERLPVPEKYRQEKRSSNSEVFVYDALYYAGHCNAGPKIIALHLPKDPKTAEITGTRSMQLKNVMEAKFSEILLPIAEMMITKEQLQYISSDAFFMLTAFHEIAASLGLTNTVNNKGTVSNALKEYHGAIDATTTDLMALYLINQLHLMGELTKTELQQAYTTSFASVMRSSRFGTAGAHGIAGMIRFNFFEKENVFSRCNETNTYTVDVEQMITTVEKALNQMIMIQGDGDYDAAKNVVENYGQMPQVLQNDIKRINEAKIPVDVRFKRDL